MLIFDFASKGHPEGENVAAEDGLDVLDLPPVPQVDLNQWKITASLSRYCCRHSRKGRVQFLLAFIPSRVVELVVTKQVWPKKSATIISPTSPAERHVTAHMM